MSGVEHAQRAAELLTALEAYRPARQAFLATLGLPASNRDPFAEFSEQLVHALMGGTLAASRVQVGHDLVVLGGQKVQVRYLANPGAAWMNEHFVHRIDGVPLYALVLFEAFEVTGVLVFPGTDLTAICAALGKRHPRQDETLQFTRRNFWAIRDDPQRFRQLGMRIWLPPLEFDESDAVPNTSATLPAVLAELDQLRSAAAEQERDLAEARQWAAALKHFDAASKGWAQLGLDWRNPPAWLAEPPADPLPWRKVDDEQQ